LQAECYSVMFFYSSMRKKGGVIETSAFSRRKYE